MKHSPFTFIAPLFAFLLLLATVSQCYAQAPFISNASPANGSTAGGTPVIINGSNFTGATSVTFGGAAATTFTVLNPNQINATTPAHAAGTVAISVTTPGGTANWTVPGFTYITPAPTVSSVSPSSGSTNGGTSVTITGTNFTGATSVTFDGVAATGVSVVNATTITASTPAHIAGPTVAVAVTTPGGTGSKPSAYTYAALAPTVSSVSPGSGPISGGTSVTITGTDFIGATSVTFGGTAATGISVVNSTTITATTPSGAVGAADVAVTNPVGTGTGSGLFTYNPVAPTVTAPTVAGVSATAATLGGSVGSDGGATITERGVVYAPTTTNNDPLIGGIDVVKVTVSGTSGTYTAPVTGLAAATGYSFKAYATNSAGTTYSTVATFTTLSTNANLSALSPGVGTLSPAFDAATLSYGISVIHSVDSITITPTLADTNATVKVNGSSVASGTASSAIALNPGDTIISVVVTAQDGVTTKTYTVTVNRDPILAVTFNSTSDVGLSASSYTATGSTVNITLNFAPVTGTQLMVVRNTGIGFISGTFSNLAQGQTVALTYGAATYNFVANYYGGTGNDLVLVWKGTHPYAWGLNSSGQLGNNSTTNSSVPVVATNSGVLSGRTVVMVAGGGSHSVALCSDGTVAAWGNNYFGQLGNNSTGQSTVPVAVDHTGVLAGKSVVAVAVGLNHTLALCSDGTVAAWGENAFGILGNNSTALSTVPVAVDVSGVLAGKTVVAVAAGGVQSLALCSDGTLAAWGKNSGGQLGNNSNTNSSVPVAVDRTGVLAGKTVVAVASGYAHCLALCSDGTVAAWGGNSKGQLGNNSTTDSLVPVELDRTGVVAGKTVVSVSAGNSHSLAFCSDGTVATWGWNANGQLGNNSTTDSLVPVAVNSAGILSGKTVVSAFAGRLQCFTLCSDGTAAAWGANDCGQLGNNSTTGSPVPVAVTSTTLAPGEQFIGLYSGCESAHGLALVAPPLSHNADLAALALSIGTLSPAFNSGTLAYTSVAGNADASLTVTPTLAEGIATVTVNGVGVVSGTASGAIALNVGNNELTVVVTAQDGVTTKTYTVMVNRSIFTSIELSSLTLSSGSLSPAISHAVAYYTASVPYSAANFTLTPTAADPGASITVNNVSVASGAASQSISLNPGINTVTLVVSKDGSGNQTYTFVVIRAFAPLPVATTTAASSITSSSATLNGTANPSSSTTDGSFVYSTSPTLQPEVSMLANVGEIVYLTADSIGNVYFCEGTLIRKITPQGVVSVFVGSGTSGSADGTGADAQFDFVYSITADGADNLYAEDANHTSIRKIAPGGVVTTLPSIAPYTSRGLASDIEGNLYFMDGPRVVRRSINGTFHVLAGSTTSGYVDGAGDVARFYQSEPMTVDLLGNVYMADSAYHTIRKITPEGVVSTLAGGTGGFADGTGSDAKFNQPVDVSVDAKGNVYVLDKGNYRIRKITPGGVVTTIAGSGVSGSTNGTGTAATFNVSYGLAGSPSGDLYCAETGAHKIRYIHSQRLQAQTGLVGNSTQDISAGLTGLSEGVTYYYRAEAVNAGGISHGSVQSFTTLTVTETWLAARFTAAELLDPQVSGWSASPDNDGLCNLLEFAFGTDPHSAISGVGNVTYAGGAITRRGQPVPRTANGTDFHADFARRTDYVAAGLTYTLQFSANLTAWEDSADTPTVVASDSEMQVVTVPFPALLGNGQKPRFFRVQVVLP